MPWEISRRLSTALAGLVRGGDQPGPGRGELGPAVGVGVGVGGGDRGGGGGGGGGGGKVHEAREAGFGVGRQATGQAGDDLAVAGWRGTPAPAHPSIERRR